jgi:RNA polymerase sigma-70 factor (ECF subfamily)
MDHVSSELHTDAAAVVRSMTDPEAFVVVFRRHYAALWRYLDRRLGRDLADDLAAETFTRAFDARARFCSPDGGSAAPWLFGIAANLIADHRRAERRRLRALERSLADSRRPQAPQADDDPPELAPAGGLAQALRRLSLQDRETLLLVAWAELSPNEIAVALGVPEATVRTRLHRARRRAQGAIQASGLEHDPGLREPGTEHQGEAYA